MKKRSAAAVAAGRKFKEQRDAYKLNLFLIKRNAIATDVAARTTSAQWKRKKNRIN